MSSLVGHDVNFEGTFNVPRRFCTNFCSGLLFSSKLFKELSEIWLELLLHITPLGFHKPFSISKSLQ